MKPRHPALLDRTNTVLVVIDMQEPFLRSIHRRNDLIQRCQLLVKAAQILEMPVVTTTQRSNRMGPIISEIVDVLPPSAGPTVDKLTFSCAASSDFTDRLLALGREQILICGVESHICVSQTAADLLHLDYVVSCASDAVSSRTEDNHKLGLDRMLSYGVSPCAAEGAVMEMLYSAESPHFKEILSLIK
jgi:nicotinamidase-related amidase